ncbi:MAG: regulatory protein RecX [Lachnospiraceae bacterium]|nr:regulatory protein RecX [Lachnospiraceae bacterium]
MQVTAIEALDKSRSSVYLDGEFAFVLYKGELRNYQIKVGEELSEERYREIVSEVLSKRAKLRAMKLLLQREYTTAQLREKLVQGHYPPACIEEAMAYVASYHYTDDVRYAVQYITLQEEKRSRRRIEQDLAGKGIARDVIEEAFAAWEAQGGQQDEEAMIRSLLAKRKFDPQQADYAECRKQAAFLAGKGFSAEKIREILFSFT